MDGNRNEHEPLVSVVVPVYNVGEPLNRCVRSLTEQTYRNLEILLVDDGSVDESPALCDAWAGRDERVRVLHRQNGGVSVARNAGIDVAAGEWLMFVDGDDWLEPDALDVMMRRAIARGSELVFCGNWNDVWRGDAVASSTHNKLFDFDATDGERFIRWFGRLSDAAYVRAPWGKLFSTDLVRRSGARFPDGVAVGEDSMFTFTVYAVVRNVSCVPEAFYHYVMHASSAMGSFNPRWFADRRRSYRDVLRIVKRWNPGYASAQRLSFLDNVSIILGELYDGQKVCRGSARRQLIQTIAHDDVVAECVSHAAPHTMREKVTAKVLRTKSVTAVTALSWTMGMVKRLKNLLHG